MKTFVLCVLGLALISTSNACIIASECTGSCDLTSNHWACIDHACECRSNNVNSGGNSGVAGNCLQGHDHCRQCNSYSIVNNVYLCCRDCHDSISTSSTGSGLECHCSNH
uniref:Uncharacterized protein LOC111120161 isoform X1 n=1 Tax=Crassostrea virginica TaxID=6565 RepID=A0A8B8CN29_CRAVI|nr:uncharacterized protein LOC111120161 isoform X1 [Crassostrea virginica]